ncbi:DUF2752 domain-containing protein [Dethiothermospora halolimnae]|uniref:DUF2752 domain-containing protein n=1 Tax=Dethiothermospora halolimnae TaxID=3114390 RepID=UPI003CCBBB7B
MKSSIKSFLTPMLGIVFFYFIVFILGNNTRCYFRNVFGIPCPGCGLSRAFTSFFNGDFIGAIHYHPLFIIPIIVFIVVIFKNNKYINQLYKSNKFWNIVCIILIGTWIIRMIILFPNKEPLRFYQDGFFPRIINIIK